MDSKDIEKVLETLKAMYKPTFNSMEPNEMILYARNMGYKLQAYDRAVVLEALYKGFDDWKRCPTWAEIREQINAVQKRRREIASINMPRLTEGHGEPMPEELRKRLRGKK